MRTTLHNVSALGHGRVQAAQHAGRDIAGDASIGDVSLDPSLAQQSIAKIWCHALDLLLVGAV